MKKDKLKIKEYWIDYSYFNSKVYICETPGGTNVVVVVNPLTYEFNFNAVIAGGGAYEMQLGVPIGTAHFLEHTLASNPNKIFKTYHELDEDSFGTKYKAGYNANAATGRENLYFYAHGNVKAASRILKFIYAQLDFPDKNIGKYLEKEKKIIKAEIDRKEKEEESNLVQFERFFWKEKFPEFTEYLIGTHETVESIQSSDLKKFKEAIMHKDRTTITIQTNKFPDEKLTKQINKFDKLFKNEPSLLIKNKNKLNPLFKYSHFKEIKNKGVFFSINYFYQLPKTVNYRQDRLYVLLNSLFWKICQEYLREEKSLIYGAGTINTTLFLDFKDRGITINCNQENLLEVLDETHYVLNSYYKKFLKSPKGKKWFNGIISEYVFKTNENIDASKAEGIGIDLLEGNPYYNFDFRKSKKAMLELSTEDLAKFFGEFMKTPPGFWFTSAYEDEEILGIFEKSKFYKQWSTSPKDKHMLSEGEVT